MENWEEKVKQEEDASRALEENFEEALDWEDEEAEETDSVEETNDEGSEPAVASQEDA